MAKLLWICAGGAAGTGARHLLALWVTRRAGDGFPFGTLAVNVLGCFAMGFLAEFAAARQLSETTRLVLVTGVLGGFTTYSAFNEETLRLLRLDHWGTAFANVGATLAGCLVAGLAGFWVARALSSS